MEDETFIIGTADAIEAEYGYVLEGAAIVVVCMYRGDFSGLLDFPSINDAKAELSWCDKSQLSYL